MKSIKFPFFNENEKKLLGESINVNKDTYGTWSLWTFLLPFIVFIAPILFILFDNYDILKIIKISVNGNLPLIPVMILISLLSTDLSKNGGNQKEINSIHRKSRKIALFTGLVAFIIYVTETIEDRSNYFPFYLIISIIVLLFSNYISKVYFLIQRRSITAVNRVYRNVNSEGQLAK